MSLNPSNLRIVIGKNKKKITKLNFGEKNLQHFNKKSKTSLFVCLLATSKCHWNNRFAAYFPNSSHKRKQMWPERRGSWFLPSHGSSAAKGMKAYDHDVKRGRGGEKKKKKKGIKLSLG